MIEGKTAENGELTTTPKCRNYFGHLGKNVENFFCQFF